MRRGAPVNWPGFSYLFPFWFQLIESVHDLPYRNIKMAGLAPPQMNLQII